MPFGTDVTALAPTFSTTGASVTANGVVQTSGVTAVDFTSPVTYVVTAATGAMKSFTVTVAIDDSSKDLTAFSFSAATNPGLSTDVVATITGASIAATVPFGTDVSALVATFATTGASVTAGGVTQISGVTPNDFASPLVYRVTATDHTTKDFTVTVSLARDPSKDITAFSFQVAHNPGLATNVTASIGSAAITANVPVGTSVTSLVATFATTGTSVAVGAVPQISGVTPNDFTSAVVYHVTAMDGTTKDFTVTVSAKSVDFGTASDLTTGTGATSVVLGDFNGDGRLDLAVANPGSNTVSVLLDTTTPGATTATFTPKTDLTAGAAPSGVATADFNGDGRPDLAVTNLNANTVSIFLNTTAPGATTPSFAPKVDFATGLSPRGITIADVNGDGRPDLAIANSAADSVSILLDSTAPGATTPTFTPQVAFGTGATPIIVALGDLNGDGKPDLAVADNSTNTVSVLFDATVTGSMTAVFSAKTDFTVGTTVVSVAIADVNGDGRPDLATANDSSSTVSILLNTTAPGSATPSFAANTDFPTGPNPLAVAFGDFDGDGRPDLAVADLTSPNKISILLNSTAPGSTTASFTAKTDFVAGTNPIGIAIGDVNGDGKPDLAVANEGSNNVSVLLDATAFSRPIAFGTRTDVAAGGGASAVQVADVNGDGLLDVAVANTADNTVSIFVGTTAPGASTPSFASRVDFPTAATPVSRVIADFNGDGKPDLATASDGTSNVISVLLDTTAPGATTPTFTAKQDFATGVQPTSLHAIDLDGDGRLDLVVVDTQDNTVSILLNTTPRAPPRRASRRGCTSRPACSRSR